MYYVFFGPNIPFGKVATIHQKYIMSVLIYQSYIIFYLAYIITITKDPKSMGS